CTNFLRLVRLIDLVDKKFVSHYLTYFYNTGEIVNYQGGSNNLRNLRFSEYVNIRIPLPPLPEQHLIVAKLDTLFAHVDRLKVRLEKIPILLKQFRQSVLTQAVTGKLTEENFTETLLGDSLDDISYGTSKKSDYTIKGVPILRIPNIKEGEINETDLKFSVLDDKEYEKLKLQKGDVLIIRSNGSLDLVGKSAIARERHSTFAFAGYLIRLRPNKRILAEFLNYSLMSDVLKSQINEMAHSTSGVNNINSKQLYLLRIPLPEIATQKEIVRRVESLFAIADRIEAGYKTVKK